MPLDVKARRKLSIDAWNKVFGKDTDYREGDEETIGEAIVKFMEVSQEKERPISFMALQSITWHSGDPEDPQSLRKRYISVEQAKKVSAITSLISMSPNLEAVASMQEAHSMSYDLGIQMQVCDVAESFIEGDDIFFSDHERTEILNGARKLRKDLGNKRNRILQIAIRNLHLTQEQVIKSKEEEKSS